VGEDGVLLVVEIELRQSPGEVYVGIEEVRDGPDVLSLEFRVSQEVGVIA
jgi:hypothetical protein